MAYRFKALTRSVDRLNSFNNVVEKIASQNQIGYKLNAEHLKKVFKYSI